MLRGISILTNPSKALGTRVILVCGASSPPFHSLSSNNGTALESGVDEMVDKRFNEPTGVRTGREATAAGSDKKPIPEEEGGTRDDRGR